MYVYRWLPAVVVAVCLAAPEAHAQAWLRWNKAPAPQQDPAKRLASPKRPVVPTATPSTAPLQRHGPTVTISEAPPRPLPPVLGATPHPSVGTAISMPALASEPAQIEPLAVAMDVTAPTTPPCNDCPNQDELKATSGSSTAPDAKPDDLEIQSEIKRRLLQGH